MKWALVNDDNVVVNIVVYREGSDYQPPEGLLLSQVNDWLNIGDKTDMPEPKPSIEKRRESCLIALLSKRESVRQSGVIVNGNTFYTDNDSINTMLQAISMQRLGISNVFPRSWILSNGEVIEVSYDDIKTVAVAISAKTDACFANYMALAGQIKESSNPESIDINAGW